MLMGIGKVPSILETREIEDQLLRAIGFLDKGYSAWIITPYLTIDKLSTIRRALSEACKRGAEINVVVRDEPDQVNPSQKGLAEAIEHGLKLYAMTRLHAKLYLFEGDCGIVTSANLVDGSFEASTELGLLVPSGTLHEGLREWISKNVEPKMRSIESKPSRESQQKSRLKVEVPQKSNQQQEEQKQPKQNKGTGFCIRCKTEIPLAADRPYCLEHFRSWSYYSNPDFEEKVCHVCGKANKSTMIKPVCYDCFKAMRK